MLVNSDLGLVNLKSRGDELETDGLKTLSTEAVACRRVALHQTYDLDKFMSNLIYTV